MVETFIGAGKSRAFLVVLDSYNHEVQYETDLLPNYITSVGDPSVEGTLLEKRKRRRRAIFEINGDDGLGFNDFGFRLAVTLA